MNIADLRMNYQKGSLDQSDVLAEPMAQFSQWFDEALNAQVPEPNAMHLSTVSAEGRVGGRIVLLKGIDEGFSFFTNYQSQKGQALATHPQASLTFFWVELERQVRIEGIVNMVPTRESDEYFASRPRNSQIGAWVSNQSSTIESREQLEDRQKAIEKEFEGQTIPRPPYWGGYRLLPDYVEFWQGRPSRLHDRIAYTKQVNGFWQLVRLSP